MNKEELIKKIDELGADTLCLNNDALTLCIAGLSKTARELNCQCDELQKQLSHEKQQREILERALRRELILGGNGEFENKWIKSSQCDAVMRDKLKQATAEIEKEKR